MRATPLILTLVLLLALVAGLWAVLGGDAFAVDAGASVATDAPRGERGALDAEAAARAEREGARSAAVVAPDASAKPLASNAKTAVPALFGRVLGPDGAPIAGARVLAATSAEGTAPVPLDIELEAQSKAGRKARASTTDAEGRYRFEGLDKGKLRLSARAHGFVFRQEDRWTVEGALEQALPDLRLAAAAIVSGKVVDRAGAPIAGAAILASLSQPTERQNVSFPGRGIPLVTTAADGSFHVDELAPGPFRLLVDAAGFRVHEEVGRTTRADAEHEALLIVLEPGMEIAGSVRAEQGLPPVVRVTARLASASTPGDDHSDSDDAPPPGGEVRARHALCDAEGRFVVRGLKPMSSYRLTVTVPGSEPETWKRAVGAESAVAQAGQRGVEIAWKPETALVFQVVDAETKEPLTDLDVWAGIGRERLVRDEKGEPQKHFEGGRVRCGELRPQSGKAIHLRVRAAGHVDHEDKTLVVKEGETRDLGVLALARARVLVVRVVDAAAGTPIAGARVLVTTGEAEELEGWLAAENEQDARGQSRLWSARTDADGRARIASAPGKSVAFAATARGYLASATQHELLPAEGDAEVGLRLARGGAVIVRVADAGGRAVPGVGIAHKRPGEARDEEGWTAVTAEKKTDAQGVAHFENLAPGVHAFAIHDETGEVWIDAQDTSGAGPQWVERAVVEGGVLELAFVAPPRGDLFGRVREGGRPLEGAQLRLTRVREGESGSVDSWSGPQDPSLAQTNHEGEFRYEGFRCGEYWLSVHHATRRMGARVRVTIGEEARRCDVDLDVATIEGTVTDLEGQPLAGIDVSVVASIGEEGDGGDDAPYQLVLREDERGNTQMDYRQTTRTSERTDARGHYVLRGLATGRPLVVAVQSDLVESASSPELTLAPDEVKTGVDFHLRRAGAIQVTLAGNVPRQDTWYEVRAFLLENGGEQFRESTWIGAWNKTTTLRGLAPGKYKLVLAQPGKNAVAPERPFPSREVDVRPQETAQASFEAY
ncbi:MAG: carboxypeptidase regulatory-like domain-containing protein [Planctomycetes bacterium]|nr:carboxypeptidase regulatory-like domain-containing protein [Planctomycetota bacterium]